MKKISLILLIFLFSMDLSAQGLYEAFAFSYQNNPSLKADRAELRSIDELYSQARSEWRPTLSLVGDAGYQDSDHELNGLSNKESMVPYDASLVLTQPIFSGFKTVAAEKSADSQIRAQRFLLKQAEQTLLTDTTDAYMGVVYAEALLNLEMKREEVYEQHVSETKKRFEVGEITVTDLSQSEARYEGAKAERISAEGYLNNARTVYETVTGVPPNNLDAEPAIPVSLLSENFDEILEIALRDNASIQASLYLERSARSDVARAGGDLLPSLDGSLSGSYGRNQQVDDDKMTEFKAMATLTVPIYEGGYSYSRVRQAKETANEKRLDVDSVRLQVRRDVYRVWENILSSRAKMVAYRSQVKAYEIALESTKQEWAVGTKTVIDVMDAEEDLLDAKLSKIIAKRDEITESYQLVALLGRLTAEQLGIDVKIYDPLKNFDTIKNKWIGTGIDEE